MHTFSTFFLPTQFEVHVFETSAQVEPRNLNEGGILP